MRERGRAARWAWAVLALTAVGCARDPAYDGKSAEEWLRILAAASDPQDRIRAANAFYRAPPRTYPTLHAMLEAQNNDAEGVVRNMIRAALAQLHENATPALIKALDDSSAGIRRRAAEAIGGMRRPSRGSVDALVGRMTDSDDSVRILAVVALGSLGSVAYDARDTVRRLAETPGPLRAVALAALPEIDTESDTFMGLFEAAIRDTSESVRLAAATNALAGARSSHHDPVPLLLIALADSSAVVRSAAMEVLMRAGPRAQGALPRLRELARSSDEGTRSQAEAVVRAIAGTPPTE